MADANFFALTVASFQTAWIKQSLEPLSFAGSVFLLAKAEHIQAPV